MKAVAAATLSALLAVAAFPVPAAAPNMSSAGDLALKELFNGPMSTTPVASHGGDYCVCFADIQFPNGSQKRFCHREDAATTRTLCMNLCQARGAEYSWGDKDQQGLTCAAGPN